MEVLPGEEEEAEELEGVGLVALWGDDISGCDLQAGSTCRMQPWGPSVWTEQGAGAKALGQK